MESLLSCTSNQACSRPEPETAQDWCACAAPGLRLLRRRGQRGGSQPAHLHGWPQGRLGPRHQRHHTLRGSTAAAPALLLQLKGSRVEIPKSSPILSVAERTEGCQRVCQLGPLHAARLRSQSAPIQGLGYTTLASRTTLPCNGRGREGGGRASAAGRSRFKFPKGGVGRIGRRRAAACGTAHLLAATAQGRPAAMQRRVCG